MNNVNNDDNTIQVSNDYLDTIKNNVSNVTANLRITVTVKSSGKDGLFQTKSSKAFEGRMPKKRFLGYIYPN